MSNNCELPVTGQKVTVTPCGLDGGPVEVTVHRAYLHPDTRQPIILARDPGRGVDLRYIKDTTWGWMTIIDYDRVHTNSHQTA